MAGLDQLYAARETVFAVGAPSLPAADLVTLTDAAHIVSDASLASIMRVTLTGNRIFDRPSNLFDGARIMLEIIQDGAGSRTITFSDPVWNFSPSFPFTGLSAGAGKRDRLGFIYYAPADKLDFIAFIPGF
jgi:hypothetical protein